MPERFALQGKDIGGVGNDHVGSSGWRLPTEAEWEYACRAGTTTRRYGDVEEIAWYGENSGGTTHAVGQKKANAWGLYDTLGNVWEWCYDWLGGYTSDAAIDPTGAETGERRVVRGGGWYYSAQGARATYRYGDRPLGRYNALGIRLVNARNVCKASSS